MLSNRRRVDGVEVDAAIQDERAVNLISTQRKTTDIPCANIGIEVSGSFVLVTTPAMPAK